MNPADPTRIVRAPAAGELPPQVAAFKRITATVRLLHDGDEPQLQEFFHSHTPDTLYGRYGCLVATMTPERAHQLVNVDQTRDCALGIFAAAPGGEVLHAVGRYCLDPDGRSAELAFVVRETMRQQGMATTLLRLLTKVARARGLDRLWAQVNTHNSDMLGVFRRHGFTLAADREPGVVRAVLPLQAAAPPAARPARKRAPARRRR
ncbi:MAG: GNAT family N-acetyltransferase [Opitutaceae bacterium]|nr:GNAT family N-acetyltransferase [Opitutaceae bacterium]